MISLLVADDHGILREGLRSLIDREPDIKLSGEAGDGNEALEMVRKQRPDVLLLDVTMPGLSGLEILERVRADLPDVRTILLSVHADSSVIETAVGLGADGYVVKTVGIDEIPRAIRAVAGGERYFSPPAAREIAERLDPDACVPGERTKPLSPREREVLRLVAFGRSARDIASELAISVKTVEAHRTSLMRKLGVRKATELVRHAMRLGLIDP